MALLQERHQDTWQTIIDDQASPLGELCPAADGKPNLLLHNTQGEEIFLHNSADTAAELRDYYQLVPEKSTGVAIMIGMGLGHTPLAMLQNRPSLRHLAIFEPELGIFKRALQAQDLTKLLTDHRVIIAVGKMDAADAMAPMIRALQLENLHILKHLPCFRFAPDAYQDCYNKIYQIANSFNVGGNTTTAYGSKFIDNRLRNMSAVHHQQLLENLQNKFTGVPAILVAGGPSLNKNVHLLAEAAGKAVIIAADTALPSLLAHKVVPDFTSSIDMQDITLEKIIAGAQQAKTTNLLCSAWLTPRVSKIFPARQVYWSFSAKNMEKWLNTLLGGKMLTSGAGTVAQLNLIAAHVLGCSPIVFVGQDLAFTNNEGHGEHTALTSRNVQKDMANNKESCLIEGYGGGHEVLSNRAFIDHKYNIERAIAVADDRKFINATEGGARIKGAAELPLREVISRYCQQKIELSTKLRRVEEQSPMPSPKAEISKLTRMLKSITTVSRDMDLLGNLVTELSAEIDTLRQQNISCRKFDSLPAAARRQFLKLDELNTRLDQAKVWKLLEDTTLEGLRLSERLNHELKQLENKPERYLEWLSKALERFIAINQCRRQVLEPFNAQLTRLVNFLKKETFLLRPPSKKQKKQKNKKTANRERLGELLKLYYDNGEYVLLEQAIASYFTNQPESAELTFYAGVIAAQRSQFADMERHFSHALELDKSWEDDIAACRTQLAATYVNFANQWQNADLTVACRLLFKAIRYEPESAEMRRILTGTAANILNQTAETDQQEQAAKTGSLAAWCRELADSPALKAALTSGQTARFYRLYGEALHASGQFPTAAKALQASLDAAPDSAGTLHLLANVYFALNDYPAAITNLEQAVALDSSYALDWENIGDSLAANQPEDAILAYEKCFTALPERLILLKKMADCYRAADRLPEAREAYSIYLARIKSGTTPRCPT